MGQHKFNPFARGTTVPPPETGLKDAYGRPLNEGDEVIFHAMTAPRYRLTGVTPVLDPKAPPGLVRAVFQGMVVVHTRAADVVQQIIRTQTVEEAIELGLVKRRDEGATGDGGNEGDPLTVPPN